MQLHPPALDHPDSPSPSVEKTALPPGDGLGTRIKNPLTVYARVCSCALYFIPFMRVSVLMLVHTVLTTVGTICLLLFPCHSSQLFVVFSEFPVVVRGRMSIIGIHQ